MDQYKERAQTQWLILVRLRERDVNDTHMEETKRMKKEIVDMFFEKVIMETGEEFWVESIKKIKVCNVGRVQRAREWKKTKYPLYTQEGAKQYVISKRVYLFIFCG